MIKLGKLTDYAIAVMGQLAHEGVETPRSAHYLSGKTGIPEPTVAKILKLLSGANLVASERGAAGGYRLVKPAAQISIGEIITAMEGPITIVACVEGEPTSCEMYGTCPTKNNWYRVNEAIKSALDGVKLTEMMKAPTPNYLVKDIHVSRAETLKTVNALDQKYVAGFVTDIESDFAPKGLSEEIVRFISAKKGEPQWLLDLRLKAYRHWLTMPEPKWANVSFPPIDYQDAFYFAAPKTAAAPKSLDELDPKLLETYKKLGIPLREQEMLNNIAVDAVFDSVSVVTTFREKLHKAGVIFCSISEAVQKYPELVQKYMGSVVPYTDNKHACLNAAVFTDGTFVFIPEGVRCPMELSTYFRINEAKTGQFERTLIIAEKGSYCSYLEGCTAPKRDENQLHAAVVELIALDDAEIKYSTVQNWYPGDETGKGGIYNFVTKRGICKGKRSKISWTQVETGSAITWKYPSCILLGDDSIGEFYSVALTNNYQQADTGTKMIHIGKNTKSRIISKGISAGKSNNTYRGLVRISGKADNARNYTQCDSLLIGPNCGAHTVPYIENKSASATIEHEASTSKIGEDQLFYCRQRGISQEEAVTLIVNGFCREVLQHMPMEFAVEAQKLVAISLEGSVG